MFEGIAIYLLVLSGCCAAMAVYFYTQKQSLMALLTDARVRLDTQQKNHETQQAKHREAEESLRSAQSVLKEMEQTILANREKFAKIAKEQADQLEAMEAIVQQKDLKIEHLREENSALKNQLMSQDQELKVKLRAFKEELEAEFKEKAAKKETENQKTQKSVQKLELETEALRKDLDQARQKNAKLTAILKKVQPDDLAKTKRKIKQMEQLYHSMKGLKELTDERNHNWEIALRKLSGHILKRSDSPHEPIGELVGSALEAIGSRLVEDSLGDEAFIMGAESTPETLL